MSESILSGRAFGALLFDTDGAIISSVAAAERVWAAWAERRGLDCFLLAAKRLGQRIEDCLVFEDAPAGIQAAEAAGAALVVVTALHKRPRDTDHPTIAGYGEFTAARLLS